MKHFFWSYFYTYCIEYEAREILWFGLVGHKLLEKIDKNQYQKWCQLSPISFYLGFDKFALLCHIHLGTLKFIMNLKKLTVTCYVGILQHMHLRVIQNKLNQFVIIEHLLIRTMSNTCVNDPNYFYYVWEELTLMLL